MRKILLIKIILNLEKKVLKSHVSKEFKTEKINKKFILYSFPPPSFLHSFTISFYVTFNLTLKENLNIKTKNCHLAKVFKLKIKSHNFKCYVRKHAK